MGLSREQYREKVQVYKRLEKVWADKIIQAKYPSLHAGNEVVDYEGGKWDQTNTVLIDDSNLKALAQPHNLLQVPEFENANHQRGEEEKEVFADLKRKLETLLWVDDISKLIRRWQVGEVEPPPRPKTKLQKRLERRRALGGTGVEEDSVSDVSSEVGVEIPGESEVVDDREVMQWPPSSQHDSDDDPDEREAMRLEKLDLGRDPLAPNIRKLRTAQQSIVRDPLAKKAFGAGQCVKVETRGMNLSNYFCF